MKTFWNKNKYGFAFLFPAALFFLLRMPSYTNAVNANLFFGMEIIRNENGTFLLYRLLKNADEKTVWAITLIFYILFILLASYLFGRAIEKTQEEKKDISIVLTVLFLIAPVGLGAVGELRIFSLVFAVICFFGAVLGGLLFWKKTQIALICVTVLCALLHPLGAVCLFPPMIAVLLLKNKKEKTMLPLLVMGACYLIDLILEMSANFSGVQFKANFTNGLVSVLFLLPLLVLFAVVWTDCIKRTDKKERNIYIFGAVCPVLSLPAVFVCNTFFTFLFSMVCGQLLLFLFLFLRADKPFCMALEKTAGFFRRNPVFLFLMIAYMLLLGNIGTNTFGTVGSLIGELMSR